MPRPARREPSRTAGFGDGRASHLKAAAPRFSTSRARGSVRRCSRNASGSVLVAAAISSMKPSTANTLPGFPGARRFDGFSGVSRSQCASTRTCSTG